MGSRVLHVGLDVGSTTVKIAVVEPGTGELLHSRYLRHEARQAAVAADLLEEAHDRFSDAEFRLAACGSGCSGIVKELGAFFVQEVVANSIAIRALHPEANTAVELGGQDAKVIFFTHDEERGEMLATDMRMNGSCAGGTGAFIDQVAELLAIKAEGFNALAEKGVTVHDISGRCGVFAKTDIQPLLNQGAPKADIALSSLHAIAKQTIGGLAQGMEIRPPVVFMGGPLCFNPTLVRVFIERLGLRAGEAIVPERSEVFVAMGTALAVGTMFEGKKSSYDGKQAAIRLRERGASIDAAEGGVAPLFFADEAERAAFHERHSAERYEPAPVPKGGRVEGWLGIDAGSTTSKAVLLDDEGRLLWRYYSSNEGEPLEVMRRGLLELRDRYRAGGAELVIKGVGTTGYGELLFAKAFKADFHTVETVAHAEAAMRIAPGVSFILDVGGQDMKAISVADGVVTSIVLNEACSAGCGSFIETYSRSLGIPVARIAELAFASTEPSKLGSRCTVFMNSSIITEQKNGKRTEDIMAGVCRSIVENIFTKVIRIPNISVLGDTVLVQGGTFRNDAVLRALEQHTGATVVRPPHPGEMGAIGVALLAKKHMEAKAGVGATDIMNGAADAFGTTDMGRRAASASGATDMGRRAADASGAGRESEGAVAPSDFIGLDALDDFGYEKLPSSICKFCTNSCNRTIVRFADGSEFVTGNRCERGEITGDARDPAVRERLKSAQARIDAVPDLLAMREKLLFARPERATKPGAPRIGIPRALEFWNSAPFWRTFFAELGFEVVFSAPSSTRLFEESLRFVPSDTVCFPAKLAHGHVEDLAAKGVDRIFMPMMIKIPKENESARSVHSCAVVQGYPLVVDESHEVSRRFDIPFDRPAFHWYDRARRESQLARWVKETFGTARKDTLAAIAKADAAMAANDAELAAEARRVIDSLEGTDGFAVILSGRPYHTDPLVNHGLAAQFTRLGVPVLINEALPGIEDVDLSGVRADTTNTFHARMFATAIYGARHPNLEVVQMVSFGCGHDAIITDEMSRILSTTAGKSLLVLKLDEGEIRGPMAIRVKSFVETVRARRSRRSGPAVTATLPPAWEVRFSPEDKAKKTILVPNLSEAFCKIATGAIRADGFIAEPLPLAGTRAIELGKKFVHNDICFPAQVNVGEFLAEMERGVRDPSCTVLGLAKNCDDCRAGQYPVLARKALDDAGYPQIPIFTTSMSPNDVHPGVKIGLTFQIRTLWGLAMSDVLEQVRLRVRPYELEKGAADRVFDRGVAAMAAAIERGVKPALEVFRTALRELDSIPTDESVRRPRVFIIGEILLNYHPTSNWNLVRWLEANGMEVILPRLVDFFHRDSLRVGEEARRGLLAHPVLNGLVADVTDKVYMHVLSRVREESKSARHAEEAGTVHDLAANIDGLLDRTYVNGEGWLIPSEIIARAREGVESFVIVQPFGCLPNHITGRGLVKTLKRRFPNITILSLDYDPDTSLANVENRLQMLVISAKQRARLHGGYLEGSESDAARPSEERAKVAD